MQTKIAAGPLGQFIAQLVHGRDHLLQGRHQFGFHAAVAAQLQGLGQAIDCRWRSARGLGHVFDGQGRCLQRVTQDVIGDLA
ncbi:hypothetical protein D3C77_704540 [compost metagenome]